MEHAAELRYCLIQMNVPAMRRLHRHVFPHIPEPETDEAYRIAMHRARVAMADLPAPLRTYSKQWLAEHDPAREVFTTAVMVRDAALGKPRGIGVRDAMVDAVERAHALGLDPRDDGPEILRRMLAARQHQHEAPFQVRK